MLLFDLTATQPIGNIKRHGGGIYGEKVFFKLVEKGKPFACYYDSSKWINPEIFDVCNKRKIKLHDINKSNLSEITKEYSCLYSALPSRMTKRVKIKKIFTVHGLRRLETPEDKFRFKYTKKIKKKIKELILGWTKKSIDRKEHNQFVQDYLWDPENTELITVSNHSRLSLQLLIPEINKRNIPLRTFYSPSTANAKIAVLEKDSVEKEPYFLMVSANRAVKNCLRAMIAFDELVSDGYCEGITMKLAGVTSNFFDYSFKNPGRFEYLGYVSDEELENFFTFAQLFIYPSLNEGFGYPPLEAMSKQTPIISSCFSSIPEVCGDAVMYFNPLSIQEIKNRILQMESEDVRKEYVERGINRFKHISNMQEKDLEDLVEYLLKASDSLQKL